MRFADAEHLTRALDDDGELVALSEEEIGARLAALEEGREPSWIAPGEGWSLAGAQTKIALRREGGQWYEARGCEPTTHILKPGITRIRRYAPVGDKLADHGVGLIGLALGTITMRGTNERGKGFCPC